MLSLSGLLPCTAQEQRSLGEAKADFQRADAELNKAYQLVKDTLPAYEFEVIQEEQREWISYRDDRALRSAHMDGGAAEGTEKSNPEYWNMAAAMTETRTEILRAWLKKDEFSKEWEGVWIDGDGGLLLIRELGPREFEFGIDVVRGPTYHLGSIAGKAKVNQWQARFSVEIDPESEPGEEAWLTFTKSPPKIRVDGTNTQYFHGARAYFDGEYIRTGELTDKDITELRRIQENGGP